MRLALVVARRGDWPRARGLARAARRTGAEVDLFVMADAVDDLAANPAGRDAILDDDCDLVACATSASARGLGEHSLGVMLGSQDDHAAMVQRADRVVALHVTRQVAVVVRAADEARVAEALRAAVGLTLRGARVTVYRSPAASVDSPRIARAVETLRLLGHAVIDGDAGAALRAADAIEVWA